MSQFHIVLNERIRLCSTGEEVWSLPIARRKHGRRTPMSLIPPVQLKFAKPICIRLPSTWSMPLTVSFLSASCDLHLKQSCFRMAEHILGHLCFTRVTHSDDFAALISFIWPPLKPLLKHRLR